MVDTQPAALPDQVSPPQFSIGGGDPLTVPGVDVLALPVSPAADGVGPQLGPGSAAALSDLGIDGLGLLELHEATGKAGEVVSVAVLNGAVDWLVLVGVGAARPEDLRRAGAALARATHGREIVASTVHTVADLDAAEAFAVGAALGSFGFHWRSTGARSRPAGAIVLVEPTDDRHDELRARLRIAEAKAGAGWRARHLATVPSNVKSPAWLADQAAQIAEPAGLSVRTWDEAELAMDGFGGILAVGRASATPPRLIRLDYTPRRAGRRTPHVVLVGKGITFDTGGLSIKPGEPMVNMKRDMTGGGVVIATLAALAEVGCTLRVTGLVAAAENAVSGDALRPGDVITHHGGRTSEVTNTDAEGRLVLADALAYAVAELRPQAIVDVATLTGAMKVALGQRTGGFFANHDGLAAAFAEAAERSGERMWRLPLAEQYEEKLASRVADADNAPGGPGAITAALFLQHFVSDLPWVHLDVASVGDAPEDNFEWSAGPTGFGARLLLEWLGSEEPLARL